MSAKNEFETLAPNFYSLKSQGSLDGKRCKVRISIEDQTGRSIGKANVSLLKIFPNKQQRRIVRTNSKGKATLTFQVPKGVESIEVNTPYVHPQLHSVKTTFELRQPDGD